MLRHDWVFRFPVLRLQYLRSIIPCLEHADVPNMHFIAFRCHFLHIFLHSRLVETSAFTFIYTRTETVLGFYLKLSLTLVRRAK